MAAYAPMARPGGATPSALASYAPMQRPQSQMAAFAPMMRPDRMPPLPPPNPERLLEGAPMLAEAQAAPAAPPQAYGPGMAVPRGTPGTFAGLPVQPPGFDALLRQRYGPGMLSMDTAQGHYDALPTPQRRNIETMNLAELQQFVSSGDPSGPELARVRARMAMLLAPAGNPLQGAPMLGPGV